VSGVFTGAEGDGGVRVVSCTQLLVSGGNVALAVGSAKSREVPLRYRRAGLHLLTSPPVSATLGPPPPPVSFSPPVCGRVGAGASALVLDRLLDIALQT